MKTTENDGYEAVQLGFGARKRVNQPMKGHLKGLGAVPLPARVPRRRRRRVARSARRSAPSSSSAGDLVDVTGMSKGRGFAGGVKRHDFHGGPKTHGQSDRHRAPGSIGSGTTPGRVLKGLRMAGHMGNDRVTVRNLQVLESNPARGVLLVEGSVPGAKNGLLRIRLARKHAVKARLVEKKTAAEEVEKE